ncbi:hypothetical protein IMCC26207_10854 [Actinobacteria bacterium IMCC26207]|nr:hypothetical protein IMCC26207_10854 [Actinobacteria bacterium IMCC26207]
MKHTVRVLLLLAVTTLGLSALSGSASATTSTPRAIVPSTTCSGSLVSIVLNGPGGSSTAPTGSTVEVRGRIIMAPGADLGLGVDESISNVIDSITASLNGGAGVDAEGEGGSIRASLSPIQTGENTITVKVDIDTGDDEEELTCKFKVTGVSETPTTTLVPVDDAATAPTADVSTTTVPTATTVPAAGAVPTAAASVQGASATSSAATPAASPQSELAFTGKSSVPLGLLGLALALLGAGLLMIERKQRVKQAA